MNSIERYVDTAEDTRQFSAREMAEALSTVEQLEAKTGHRRGTIADVLAEVGAHEVERRCLELEAQGHVEAAAAIREELREVRHRPGWFVLRAVSRCTGVVVATTAALTHHHGAGLRA